MSAHALSLPKTAPANLRPFDIRRDLLAVADLVELCFASTLDADGRMYIRQMRQAARSGGRLSGWSSQESPLMGMVWVENGYVVGNLSLIPHYHLGKHQYLIANVAVHPDYQRRGIAGQLTLAALDDIRRRGARDTWLQVDENNHTAVNLYHRLGFLERTRRTSWRLKPSALRPSAEGSLQVRSRRKADWPLQKRWLDASYPRELRWHLPLDMKLLQPGWLGILQRSLSERRVWQWSAERGGELLGVLTWQSSSLEADRLWLAAPEQHQPEAIQALTGYAQGNLSSARKLALNYPAGRADAALKQAGFEARRTLIWMQFPWENPS